jgi:FlaG/FlaF family flagellin (archaellin)
VTPVIATVLLIAIILIVAGAVGHTFYDTIADGQQPAPQVAFEYDHHENGANDDTVTLTHTGGDVLMADRLILIASKPVDLGGPDESDPKPNPGYATVGEKLTEGNDQTGIGEQWSTGESIIFGAAGDLEGTTVRLVWNPVEIDKDGFNGKRPSGVVGEDSYILYKFTIGGGV